MLLADSCFNINHESFKNDLGEVLKAANNEGVEYFFCPAGQKKYSTPSLFAAFRTSPRSFLKLSWLILKQESASNICIYFGKL